MRRLRRGDLCPTVVKQVSLPAVGSSPRRISESSPSPLARYRELMVHPQGAERKAASGVSPFVDPALKSKWATTALAGTMWMAGLLMMAKQVRGHIRHFTVVESITTQERAAEEEIVA